MTGAGRWVCLAALGALVALAPAQDPGGAAADPPLSIEVVLHGAAAAGGIEFGVPFELEVIRRWPSGRAVEPWDDDELAPLVVETLSVETLAVERGEESGQLVERRRLRAHAFRLGGVTLQPEVGLVAREGAEPLRATAELRTVLIDSSLPAGDQGVAELPPAPPLEIVPVRRVVARAAALALVAFGLTWLGVLGVRRGRRRRPAAPGPRAELIARCEALAPGAAAEARDEQRAFAVEATAIVRAAERLGAERGLEPGALATLEVVKFGGRALSAADRDALLAEVRRVAEAVPDEAPELVSELGEVRA